MDPSPTNGAGRLQQPAPDSELLPTFASPLMPARGSYMTEGTTSGRLAATSVRLPLSLQGQPAQP